MPEILAGDYVTDDLSMCRMPDAGYPWNGRLNVPDILLMCLMCDAGYPCNRRLNMPDMGLLLHMQLH
jgi:hypothetical protein